MNQTGRSYGDLAAIIKALVLTHERETVAEI